MLNGCSIHKSQPILSEALNLWLHSNSARSDAVGQLVVDCGVGAVKYNLCEI